MTYLHKSLLPLLITTCFLTGHAANMPADTTKKFPLPSINNITSQFNDYMAFIQEGISDIRKDSVDKGVHLLHVAMQRSVSTKPTLRVLDYVTLELYQLLGIIDTAQLSVSEKQLGHVLIKSAFSGADKQLEQQLDAQIKDAPNTIFTKRIKILRLSFTDRKRMRVVLDDLLKEDPKLITANIYKAELLYDDDMYNNAIDYCTKVIDLWPQYAHAYHVRAKSYSAINEYKKAIDDYDKAIVLFPKYFLFDYDRAATLLDMDNYRDAANGYMKVYAVAPNYKWINYDLARCYKGMPLLDSALYYIDKHIAFNPDDGDGYNVKGDIYYDQNNYSKAIDFHNRAINLNNNRYDYYEDRADDYYYNNQLDEAIKDFEKALSINKKRAYTNDRLGDCYYRKKEYEKAITYHQAVIKIEPDYKYAYVGLYLNYSKLGKLQQSIEACKKAINIDSTYSSALGNLGWAYYLDGKCDSTIKYSYKAIKYNENATYAMFNIALATLHKGDFEKAKELYQQFVSLCKEKNYTINDGAVEDLKDLIKQHIAEDTAKYIIKNIFKEST